MVTRAAGVPDIGPSSASGFIPEIWSGKLVEKFYTSTVFGEIANTDYEGEISGMGSKVKIRTTPDIIINDYELGGGVKYQRPTSPMVELLIDKAKSFGFEVNAIDAMQSDLKLMDDWSNDGGQQMKIAIDRSILGDIYADAHTYNQGATAGKISRDINLGATGAPVQLSKTNILDYIVDLGTVLDEQDAPEENRWLLLPAWATGMVKKSDLKDASITGDNTSVLRNGRLGMIDRFTLYQSNNLSKVVDGANSPTNIVAGHKSGLTFAAQMTDMETLKNPNDFGDLVRGLNVYGYKVTKGESIVHGYVYK